jgi:hypothetical protein
MGAYEGYFPPTAMHDTFMRAVGVSLKISKAALLSNDVGPGPLGIASFSVSTNGVTLTEDATRIFYHNPNNVADQFSYTVTNAWGADVGTVNIQIGSVAGSTQGISWEAGGVTVKFAGIPGYTYIVQRAPTVGGPWTDLLTTNAPTNGLFEFVDGDPLSPSGYYRLRTPIP